MINKKCEICGSCFSVKPYRVNTARFCSKSCMGKKHCEIYLNKSHEHKKGNKWRLGLKPSNPFEVGNKPWNYGLKGIRMSISTEFKKGMISDKKLPLFSERIRKDKNGSMRRWIKTSENGKRDWELNYQYLWKKQNGEIPKGYILHHIDHNSLNDDISNLQLMTRSEHINHHRKDLKK